MPRTANDPTALPIVLDTDIGTDVDDLLALTIAATDDRLDLRAVTTINGDTVLRARIAAAVLTMVGRDHVPVGAGAAVGLSGRPHPSMPSALGHEGQGVPLSSATSFPSAAEVLSDVLATSPTPVTICATGALTNIAQVLMEQPDLIEQVAAVHFMGGCLAPIRWGKVLLADATFSEHNVSADPLASFAVLAMPVPVRLAPIDVTATLRPSPETRRAIAEAGEFGRFVDEQIEIYLAAQQIRMTKKSRGRAEIFLHDPLVVAALADPGIATVEQMRIAAHGHAERVVTRPDSRGRSIGAVRHVDGEELQRALVRAVRAASAARTDRVSAGEAQR